LLAYDPKLCRDVALKVPRADILVNPEVRARFHQEACAAAALDHPNLVPVYDAGEVGPMCYIASAFCPGVSLAQWIRQQTDPVPAGTSATRVTTLAEAVQHAHGRGILHRDLKPGNVLLVDMVPKITDFGLAKLLEGARGTPVEDCRTHTGAIVGTPSY